MLISFAVYGPYFKVLQTLCKTSSYQQPRAEPWPIRSGENADFPEKVMGIQIFMKNPGKFAAFCQKSGEFFAKDLYEPCFLFSE